MFRVQPGDRIFDQIQGVQQGIREMEYPIERAEQQAESTYSFGSEQAPEEVVADLNHQMEEVAQQLVELRVVAKEVNAKVLPVIQKRIAEEVGLLDAKLNTLKERIVQLPATHKLKDEVVALMRQLHEAEPGELPALSKLIITVMERKPSIPLGLFIELHNAKQRIDQINAEEERRMLPEAFNTFFQLFDAVKNDKKGGKSIIQKAVGSLPKEVKQNIYGKIYEADGKPKTKDGLYGEHHVVDSLTRLRKIVEAVRAEMLETEDDERFMPRFPRSFHFSGHDLMSHRGALPQFTLPSFIQEELGSLEPRLHGGMRTSSDNQDRSIMSPLHHELDLEADVRLSRPLQQEERLPVEGHETYYLAMMHKACKGGNIDQIREAMQADFNKMPEKLRNEIYAAISQDAGRSKTDLKFGKENLFTDRTRFVRVIEKRPDVQAQIKLLDVPQVATRRLGSSDEELNFEGLSSLEHKSALHRSVAQHDAPLVLNRHQQIEQLMAHLDELMRNSVLKANKPKLLEALHALLNETSDRDFKLEVYREIGKQAKKSSSSAEQYGRDHFADDLAALQKILQTKYEKAILEAGNF